MDEFRVDKLMRNGVWWKLSSFLRLCEAKMYYDDQRLKSLRQYRIVKETVIEESLKE